jgi:hypothetical protein
MILWGKTKEPADIKIGAYETVVKQGTTLCVCMHCDVTSVATCVNNVCAEEAAYLPLRQLKLAGSGCELVSGI